MSRIRHLVLASVALVTSLAWAASAQAKPGHPPEDVFFARPQGDRGPAIAHDAATGGMRFALPAGILSADRSTFAASAYAGDAATNVDAFDAASGKSTLRMPLAGQWMLQAVSPDGRFAALASVPSKQDVAAWTESGAWQTEIQVLDLAERRPKHVLKLAGNFEAEAISASGSSLFLVEHLPAARPDRYAIRWYDLSQQRLVADPLRSKTADEIMSGYAWGGEASTDGDWLFTLYVSTNRKVAFVHMLNTKERFTVCVDLPSGAGDFEALKHYTLAYSPQRRTLYAMNARLGVVAEIKLGEYQVNGTQFVANKQVTFPPMDDGTATDSPRAHSALSADEGTLAFAAGGDAFVYDIGRGVVRQHLKMSRPITGLGFSPDGARIFAPRADETVAVITASAARARAAAPDTCPVSRPADPPFVPASRKPDLPPGWFWYGSEDLWTVLTQDGTWSELPQDEAGYSNKVFWWRAGYDWRKDPQPALTVTGRRLDLSAPPLLALPATNAYADDIGSAMLTGVSIPTSGCWEIIGRIGDASLRFVVWVG